MPPLYSSWPLLGTTKSENKPYTWEEDLHQRLLTDFSRTETEVKD